MTPRRLKPPATNTATSPTWTDTSRNHEIGSQRSETDTRRLVMSGRDSELRTQIEPFNSATGSFEAWARGEFASHPNSWKRICVSMTSAKVMFGKRPISSITRGDIEDYGAVESTRCEV